MKLGKRLLHSEAVRALLVGAAVGYIRLLRGTTRWQARWAPASEAIHREGRPFLGCFWHGRLMAMAAWHRRPEDYHVMISAHRDGLLISRIIGRIGSATVAGSSSFARLVDSPDADEAFLCGLLSHLGQLVLARCLPDTYAPVLEAAGARWPSLPMERRLLGLCHSDVAATLLSEWGLPTAVVVPVSYMFRPNELGETAPELRRLTFLMAVTGLMVQVLCDASKSKALAKLHELCAKHFDLTEREVDSFLIGLESGIRETAELLSLPVAEGLGHQELVDEARQRMVSVSLGTAMDLREARRKAEDLTERNRELLDRATADKLTGVANRAAFDQVLDEAVRARLQPGSTRSLGLVLLDIDHFKRFNDTHGHQAGDAVLAAVGQHLKGVTRRGDLAARYGGEEFALLLPSTTPALLGAVAERVRAGLEDLRVTFGDEQLQVTASLGGACLTTARRAEDAQALVAAADELLYRAKHGGRNRCEVRREEELPGR